MREKTTKRALPDHYYNEDGTLNKKGEFAILMTADPEIDLPRGTYRLVDNAGNVADGIVTTHFETAQREDVERHPAFMSLIGHASMTQIPVTDVEGGEKFTAPDPPKESQQPSGLKLVPDASQKNTSRQS